MRVLHLLTSGGIGGIETLCNEINNRSSWDNIFFFRKEGGAIYESILQAGGKIYVANQKRKLSIKTFKLLLKICKENDVDIVNIHHEDVYLQIYYLLLKRFCPRIKFIWTIHSCFEEQYSLNSNKIKNIIIKRLLKKTMVKSNLLISVSNAVKNSYSNYFRIDKEKFITIYNGTAIRSIRNIEKEKNSKKELLYVGRICEVKGIQNLIKAIHNISYKESIHLSIVGDGPERGKMEMLAGKLLFNNTIEFYGKRKNVKEYLNKADIFIYPSIWEEAFGISIIEAMAVGIPVIASKNGGIPEIITDGYDGFLLEDINAEKLSKKIEEVIELINNDEITKIQENARNTAKKFNINNTIEKLEDTYRNLIEQNAI